MSQTAYWKLEKCFRRLLVLRDAAEVLQWDYAAMMPAGGGPARGEQLAELSAVSHSILSDPETADLLANAEEDT